MRARNTSAGLEQRFSIFSRAMLTIGSALAVVTVLMTLWTIREQRLFLTAELESRLAKLASQQAVSVSNSLWDLNRDSTEVILQGLEQDPDFVSAKVSDEKGRVFAQVGADHFDDRPVLSSSADIVIELDGALKTIGKLTLTLSRERLLQAQWQSLFDALIFGLVQLAAVVLATALALRAVTGRLGSITDRMLRVAKGDLEQPTPHTDRPDEIGDIARAVEVFRVETFERRRAQDALAKSQAETARAREQLVQAIETFPEGFAWFDSEDRLVLFNSEYLEFYPGISEFIVPGAPFEDIVRKAVERGPLRRHGRRRRGLGSATAGRASR